MLGGRTRSMAGTLSAATTHDVVITLAAAITLVTLVATVALSHAVRKHINRKSKRNTCSRAVHDH